MPQAHPSSVVTFSSEDPYHPASNLLNRDTYRKWKCKDAGEKEAFVVLKFDKALQITAIDIGNECSAMVEVFVGRSGENDVKYAGLLSSSVLMSPQDCRSLNNPCGVRNYSINSFDRETAAEKWDLVKVVVSQMFNKHIQYGLSFIKFTVAADPTAPISIGRFALRKPLADEEEEDERRIGAMFAKTLEKSGKEETNAAIREVTKAIAGAAQLSNEDKVKEVLKRVKLDVSSLPKTGDVPTPKGKLPNRKSLIDPPLSKQSNSSPTASTSTASATSATSAPDSDVEINQGDRNSNGPSRHGSNSFKPDEDKDKVRKPFEKLFEGVVFVMSGFENPYRKNLRDRALEMGAKCRPDWDSSCTHLICAFINTPKFQQVKATRNGKIVRKEWVERSYGMRRRYPWRRFCLDRNDKGDESEEEILAESDSEQTHEQEEEEPSSKPVPISPNFSATTTLLSSSPNESDENTQEKSKKRKWIESEEANEERKSIYEADTDVDEDNLSDRKNDSDFEEVQASPGDKKKQFFAGSVFFLSLKAIEKEAVEGIILNRKGSVVGSLTDAVDYLVTSETSWNEEFSEALSDNPNLNIVHKDWILKCESVNGITSSEPFIIIPS